MFLTGKGVHTIDGTFSGVLIGRHGAGLGTAAGEMLSDGTNINLYVDTVMDPETGEIRQYARTALELDE